ncbi:alpha/beta hydrolase fold protein [Catenulispora acidiphila DSM 44928]|uniref:Alpha/beta hydrolase fold protein n=1 Tax=Catenulispora acidiphila (strain DSM 44928 / JCM 14897 / NBRC 102108 / NRRL B-24433 / ID139908) TaxID=479433 RepID=C7PZC7_CATAD|nr:alpha/beta hydrolase [Catenulispora acidiphila]ACU71584.1 alpha/beta hydrolase fold protein [Catenulispora acidiphila DSM 44928]
MPAAVDLLRVPVNGIEVNVAVCGTGPEVLLLHGFPHTWQLWSSVMGPLSDQYRVIAPDLRGLGATTRAADGYDAENLAADAEGLLAALNVDSAAVVGIDAGTPPAFLLAMRRPDLVRRLVLMEAFLGRLPGAEDFLPAGPPWWFGFHAVPGLAEQVLAGHEPEYVDWFLTAGTQGRGIPAEVRDAFVAAYTGTESLRCAFEHYRAMPATARQIQAATLAGRLSVPTLAVGAHPVGPALYHQLRQVCDDVTRLDIAECGHIIPLDRPAALLTALTDFLP